MIQSIVGISPEMRLRSNAKSDPIKKYKNNMELCPGCSRNLGQVSPRPKPEDEGGNLDLKQTWKHRSKVQPGIVIILQPKRSLDR